MSLWFLKVHKAVLGVDCKKWSKILLSKEKYLSSLDNYKKSIFFPYLILNMLVWFLCLVLHILMCKAYFSYFSHLLVGNVPSTWLTHYAVFSRPLTAASSCVLTNWLTPDLLCFHFLVVFDRSLFGWRKFCLSKYFKALDLYIVNMIFDCLLYLFVCHLMFLPVSAFDFMSFILIVCNNWHFPPGLCTAFWLHCTNLFLNDFNLSWLFFGLWLFTCFFFPPLIRACSLKAPQHPLCSRFYC